jgi:hypothetical protein
VLLYRNSEKVGETSTDNFGDSKFDNLEEKSGPYTLEIRYRDYEKKTLDVKLNESVNIGTIMFE